MASCRPESCTDQEYPDSTSSGDISEQEFETDLSSEEIQDEDIDETSSEIADLDDDETFYYEDRFMLKHYREVVDDASIKIEDSDDEEESFNNEDKLIARLYWEVVDDIMNVSNMQESEMYKAIAKMKRKIHQWHMTKCPPFNGIDFCIPSNRCGYLRRYAICHTGLVKKAVWRFFLQKELLCKFEINAIFKTKQLKIVSLGGGPGNDLVGFCSALNETVNCVEKLDLTIVDISKGWEPVFPSIVKKAIDADLGSFSKVLKRVEMNTSFVKANLNARNVFKRRTLSSLLNGANLVLMVKLTSFMPDHEAQELFENVADTMRGGALLVVIDQPFKKLFDRTSNLLSIYNCYQKYEMSFNPSKYRCPSIPSAEAHMEVFKKC